MYRAKPRNCLLHKRYADPFNRLQLAHMRWRNWGGRRTVGFGQTVFNSYGFAQVKVVLKKRRYLCGHSVYTQAHYNARVHRQGHHKHIIGTMGIDDCLV